MRSLLFIILAGYAVRCDDASYYVIEMPEEPQRQYGKPFRAYWNVPTMQCKSKRIPFDDLFEKYGIVQNSGDSFRGEKVSILYDPGLFPALLKNQTSGEFIFRNEGVPQEGDLERHLVAFRSILEQSIPDKEFSGLGIIDFESWRPIFRQNFGELIPYKDVSYQIERKQHWFWTDKAIKVRARERFEQAARAFMKTTLALARQLRPRARWGYYGFPYCFNMASSNMHESCAHKVPQENNNIYWLWSESTALYPSLYSSKDLTSSQLAGLVRGRTAEAARVRRGDTPILPYFWFRYRDGDFMSQTDLNVVFDTLYKSDASGFIIWGSSNDVNTVDKCKKLLKYTTEILGPAIARYTKAFSVRNTTYDSETTKNPVSNSIGLTTWRPMLKDHLNNANNSKKPVILDPDYHWDPPENYTQNIVHFVEKEFKKKSEYKANDTEENQTVLVNSDTNSLIEILLNLLRRNGQLIENETTIRNDAYINNEYRTSSTIDPPTKTYFQSMEQSTLMPGFVTKNPLDALKDNTKNFESSTENKSDADNFVSSTLKLNTYIFLTTPFYYTTKAPDIVTEQEIEKSNHEAPSHYTTKAFDTFTNKEIENIKHDSNNSPEELSLVKPTNDDNIIIYDEDKEENINKLLGLSSISTFTVNRDSTDKPHFSLTINNSDNLTTTEESVESISSNNEQTETSTDETSITENMSNEKKNEDLLQLQNKNVNQSDEYSSTIPTISTFEVDNITDISSSTESKEVTSTSHEFATVPLFNTLGDNLSTVSYEELFNERFNHTTNFVENTSTSEGPDTTLEFTININTNSPVTSEGDIINKTFNTIELKVTDSLNIGTASEPTTNFVLESSTAEDFIQKQSPADNFSINSIETSTEDSLIFEPINIKETTKENSSNRNSKAIKTEIESSTTDAWSDINSSTTGDAEILVRYTDHVPDSIVGDSSISTTETTSTIEEDPQVTSGSRSSAEKINCTYLLLSLISLYCLRNTNYEMLINFGTN